MALDFGKGVVNMIKELELQYTVNNLVKLAKEKYGENATQYLAGRLESVISEKQMMVLIDSLTD